jgi:hypothetical protein
MNTMMNVRGLGRLGLLTVGLGVGIGVATAATAAAAPTMPVDPVPVVPDLAVPGADIPGLDLSISFDGFSLLQSGNALAETGTGDFAIAYGSDSFADAGTDLAGSGTSDTAMAFGDNSSALSGYGTFDNALATDGGFAEAGGASSSLTGSSDSAWYLGPAPFTETSASGALAGWVGGDTTGSNDIATVFDPSGTLGSIAAAGDGNFDLGAAVGDGLTSVMATGGNFLVDIQPPL